MTLYAEAADGTFIAYEVHGKAADGGEPAILLVHGFAADSAMTWNRTGWIRALQDAGRVVLTLDLRGHGLSDKPVAPKDYAVDVQARDLIAVLDSAGLDTVDVVAYSMGNRVLSALTAHAPGSVRRVVVGGAGPNELFAQLDMDQARALLMHGEPAADGLVAQVVGMARESGGDPQALLACIEGVAGAPLMIPRPIPVLFVVGELDPVPAGADTLAAEWDADIEVISGRDHVSTLTSRQFKDAAIGFLRDSS